MSIWESEALELGAAAAAAAAATAAAAVTTLRELNSDDTALLLLPAVERVHRLRAEAAVRTLVDGTGLHVSTPPSGEVTAHNAAAGSLGIRASKEDTGEAMGAAAAAGPIAALMRELWPRLISAAVDGREWEFMCR